MRSGKVLGGADLHHFCFSRCGPGGIPPKIRFSLRILEAAQVGFDLGPELRQQRDVVIEWKCNVLCQNERVLDVVLKESHEVEKAVETFTDVFIQLPDGLE